MLEKDQVVRNQTDSQPEIQKHTRLLWTEKIRTRVGMWSLLHVHDIASRNLVGRGLAGFQGSDVGGHAKAGFRSRDLAS